MKISNSDAITTALWDNASTTRQSQNAVGGFQQLLRDQVEISDEGKVLSQSNRKAPEISLSSQEKSFFNDMFNTPVYSSVVLSDSELSYFNTAFSAPAAYGKGSSGIEAVLASSLRISV